MRGAFPLALAGLALGGCGYIGPPLPPALDIPVPIRDLRGVQRGDKILVAFTPPVDTTDQMVLAKPPEIELRVGENPKENFELQRWAGEAKRIPVPKVTAGGVELAFPAEEFAGREVVIVVRAIGPTKRPSDWSNLLVLQVQPAPQPPGELTVRSSAGGPYLQWKGAGAQWRIWRLDEGAKEAQILGVSGEASWLDQTGVLGKTYTYMVQQLVGSGEHPAESEMSAEIHLKHEDKFAPAIPAGLQAITGLKTVELSWDRNTEADLKGYQVYRGEGDAALAKLGGVVEKPTLSDGQVKGGQKYRYAVAAVDESGNESAACAAVEAIAP